jgi:ABC-type bacteriocin/lantibiotic exporter with double-glycine peptidase domain
LQDSWIQDASIKDNILMCNPCDEQRYRRVLEACALQEDIAAMADGDATIVGEKGVALSGETTCQLSVRTRICRA